MSAFGLAKQLNISRTEAKKYIEAYFMQYPGIQAYMDKMKILVSQYGYVKTLLEEKSIFVVIKIKIL